MINRIPFNPDPKETAILTAMRQLESALNDAGYMVIITDMTNQDGRTITFAGQRESDAGSVTLTHIPINDDQFYSVAQYEWTEDE